MGFHQRRDTDFLQSKARRIREGILECIGVGRKGHLGGSMSSADIVAALYFYKMNHNPKNSDDPARDRLIFSKGHSVLAQYAALAACGYFPWEELKKTKTLGSMLQGHPEANRTPGVEANTGSLGQGLSIGLGMALGGRLDGYGFRVYVILGDGELGEGQVWEAAGAASFYGLDSLVAVIDNNGVQATGPIAETMDLGDPKDKFAAFGWEVLDINGHDTGEIVAALDAAERVQGSPVAIIARTVKGKGVSFAENLADYHNNSLTGEEFRRAKNEIGS